MKPCCSNTAVITAGTEQHAAGLRCASCNRHRGWLTRETLSFIGKTLARFGAPSEPITVRQQQKEASMAFEQRPNSGALFKDDKKSKPSDRDYSGSIKTEDTEYWLSGWIKETKNGQKYLSLALKPKIERPDQRPLREAMGGDAVPF